MEIVERISHAGPIAVGAAIGASAAWIAIEAPDHVALLSRTTHERSVVAGAALDPYKLTLARVDGYELVISALG